jgi:histidinol dehydrogenase
LSRPILHHSDDCQAIVQSIISDVKNKGDLALKILAQKWDNMTNFTSLVSQKEINSAEQHLTPTLKRAIDLAYKNIHTFHVAQRPKDITVTTQPGVFCELKYQAIESVGLYVPGGTAPLPSSVLMQGVLAQLSGAHTIVLATPAKNNHPIHPAILYAAKLCGIQTIVPSGGAGAIAALAFGTQTIPAVNKIFGPGNTFVTMAKQLVVQQVLGLAIDMPAGPSEVLIIADEGATPEFVAADLLSQAEHGDDSHVVLLSTSRLLIEQTQKAILKQLKCLSRIEIIKKSLRHSAFILVDSIEQAFDISANYAPEHLILQLRDGDSYSHCIRNAASVFVGDYTPESVGDYASGTNHVLPTYGYSRVYSSLHLLDFYRTYTVQHVNQQGLQSLAHTILPIAKAEGLDAHANAVSVRLNLSKSIKN